jgi:hypothetical protein
LLYWAGVNRLDPPWRVPSTGAPKRRTLQKKVARRKSALAKTD